MELNPLEQLNPVTMAAMAVIFVAAFLVLKKIFFTPLIDVMEKRADKLEKARAKYREADALLEQAREEAGRIVAEARAAAESSSEQVKGEVALLCDAKCAEANAEAERILARGREEVARVQEEEQAKLKELLLTCSKQTLVKMIPRVDDATLRFVVNRVLAARGAGRHP